MSERIAPLGRDELLALIREAFADVQRGSGVSLREARAIDDHATGAQRLAARQKDADTHWGQVPDADIAEHDAVFSFMDLRGHQYYAPAYMSWLVRQGYDTSSNSVETAQFAFDPWGKVEGGQHLRPHEMFTPAQCACIARYLQYVAEVLDEGSEGSTAGDYLRTYWSRYL